MSHIVPTLAAIAFGLSLVGCDSLASSGGGSTAEVGASSEQIITRTAQLYPYLVMAGKTASCSNGLPDLSVLTEHFYSPVTVSISLGEYKTLDPKILFKLGSDFRAAANQVGDNQFAIDAMNCVADKYERAARGDWGGAAASILGSWLLAQTESVSGWPCKALERGACADYMVNSLTSAIAADAFAQVVIAEAMANQGGKAFSEDEVLARLTSAMEKHAVTAIESVAALQKRVRGGNFVSDLTGSAEPIHFTSGEWDYQAGPGGVLLTRYGSPYAGRGMIGGVDYKVEMVISSGTTQPKG